ncbi:MAG: GAF domain-containing SpoIIE family protein phosphatase [Thermoleophilaceae bacterium]
MSTLDANPEALAATPAGGAAGRRAPGDPLDLVLDRVRDVVRADAAMIVTVDRDRTTIEPLACWFASDDLERAIGPATSRPYERGRPWLTEAAIERGRPLLLPRLEDWEAAANMRARLAELPIPGAWGLLRQASVIACPVRTALGRTVGALIVLSLDPRRPLERPDLDLATVLADLAALACERTQLLATAVTDARAFSQERHLARTLTHGFVPASLPAVPGWDVGLLYEPSDDQATGGDLYGVWQVGDELAVLIGDVAGKGVETAALSAMARFFVEARSWDCDDPARVLDQVSAILHGRLPPDRFVTAFLGFVGRRRLRYANAGHLAPLLLHADGGVSEAAVGGLPLGVGEGAEGYVQHELELAPDDTLVAFTDGVLEARRDGTMLGHDGLRRVLCDAVAMATDPQALVELVHDQVRAWAHGLGDDAATHALRRRGPVVTRTAKAP